MTDYERELSRPPSCTKRSFGEYVAENDRLREGAIMASTMFKCEFPRRQAMLSVYEPSECYPWQDVTVVCKRVEVARVPVFVWPMPTQDGCFIVEYQDGHCQKVQPNSLTFLGSKELFDQYDWMQND